MSRAAGKDVPGSLIIIVSLSVSQKNYAQARKRGRRRELRLIDHNKCNPQGISVKYCPVCKREYKEMSKNQTLHCPVCGSTLIQISDDAIAFNPTIDLP
jgi:DNA-directed RNA polymerase subunit RPC12/RpoP